MFKEWHHTLSKNFYGYIDNFFLENNSLRISGWIIPVIDKDNIDFYIEIDSKPLSIFIVNERQDVAQSYETIEHNFIYSGFDISIPKPNNSLVKILGKFNDTLEEIFVLDLNKNYIKNITDSSIQEYEEIKISKNLNTDIVVVDNFYEDPDLVRRVALQQTFDPDIRYFKGKRTVKRFLPVGTKQIFERMLNKKINVWEEHNFNGIFQYCTAQDPLVYHSDTQSYAGVVFLTPNAPPESGTSFYRSRILPEIRKTHVNDSNFQEVFDGDFYDKTRFDLVDTVGNVYNRLVLWDASMIHSASQYFGNNKLNSRLFHLFFFDTE